jgi:hypothetical protein
LNQKLLRQTVFTLPLCLIFNLVFAQNFSQSGINVGAKVGISKLLGEIPFKFSETVNEFDNKVSFASAIEISKYISPRWEIGTDIEFTTLNGSTANPEFSAEGIQLGIPKEITEPVEYNNKLIGPIIFFRYFFKPVFSESAFNPFIRAGGGFMGYNSKFKYIDAPDDDLLFGKGTEGYTKLSTPVFVVGTGFKTSVTTKFYIITSVDFNMVNYDFLDVVHNYDTNNDERQDMIGLYTEIKIAVFYKFSKLSNSNNKQNSSRQNDKSSDSYLPFSR